MRPSRPGRGVGVGGFGAADSLLVGPDELGHQRRDGIGVDRHASTGLGHQPDCHCVSCAGALRLMIIDTGAPLKRGSWAGSDKCKAKCELDRLCLKARTVPLDVEIAPVQSRAEGPDSIFRRYSRQGTGPDARCSTGIGPCRNTCA